MLIRTKNNLSAFCALLLASLAAIFPSCNRETPQNMEADILTFMIAEDGHLMEVASSDNVINYYLSQYHSLDSLNAVVTLSDNATISPDPATVHDFSQPVTFTVVSQDRQWNRIYTVNVINTSLVYNGDFEEWQGTGSGNNFYETPVGWTSANSGVRIIHGMGVPNLEFPTVKTDNAYSGNFAVSLNTRQGGQTSLVPRLIAGSIFLGRYSPEPLGDYMAGPNHTLPTGGSAKFSSPLSVDDFVTASQFTCYTKEALKKIAPSIVRFAGEEGLQGHARSILSRFEGNTDE